VRLPDDGAREERALLEASGEESEHRVGLEHPARVRLAGEEAGWPPEQGPQHPDVAEGEEDCGTEDRSPLQVREQLWLSEFVHLWADDFPP